MIYRLKFHHDSICLNKDFKKFKFNFIIKRIYQEPIEVVGDMLLTLKLIAKSGQVTQKLIPTLEHVLHEISQLTIEQVLLELKSS
jgi:hypothetical protein